MLQHDTQSKQLEESLKTFACEVDEGLYLFIFSLPNDTAMESKNFIIYSVLSRSFIYSFIYFVYSFIHSKHTLRVPTRMCLHRVTVVSGMNVFVWRGSDLFVWCTTGALNRIGIWVLRRLGWRF